MSHDLWTAVICWACALAGYLLFQGKVSVATQADGPLLPEQTDTASRAAASWQGRAAGK